MKKLKKFFNQHGQTAVFFALLLPAIILFLFVVFDLGWLYLNKSRLQNAAEAAAIAGANKFCEETGTFNSVKLIYEKDTNYEKLRNDEKIFHDNDEKVIAAQAAANTAATYSWTVNLGGSADAIEDSWTKTEVNMPNPPKFYSETDDAETIYYEVKLEENVTHIFKVLDKIFTTVPAVAVAEITKINTGGGEEPPGITPDPESPETIETVETIRNTNVVVANWQIQEHYRKNLKQYNGVADVYYKTVLAGNNLIPSENLYIGAWNEYQDYNNHYNGADLNTRWYRTETINIWDDVEVVAEGNDINGNDVKVYNYGTSSSVIATSANTNTIKESDAYNPQALSVVYNSDGTVKYNEEGYIEIELQKDANGNIRYDNNGNALLKSTGKANPYTWENLDSIDIDVRPDVTFKTQPTKDWDLVSGYFSGIVEYISGVWSGKKDPVKNTSYLRIHTRVNFGTPYKVRPNKTEPDILWARLESEAMYPVQYNWNSNISGEGLNSVRQFIINVEESNFDKGSEKYRPVVIFYDGPEKLEPNNPLRNSKPLIINLNADFRGIIYAPNSPVVFLHNNHQFKGFIIAKSYLRLKKAEDFEEEGIYNKVGNDFVKKTSEKNPYYHADAYVTQELETVNRTYHKVTEYPNPNNNSNRIEMYVDSYGNVAYATPTAEEFAAMNVGTYDTFNITDFTSHGYTISQSSENILLGSGN